MVKCPTLPETFTCLDNNYKLSDELLDAVDGMPNHSKRDAFNVGMWKWLQLFDFAEADEACFQL